MEGKSFEFSATAIDADADDAVGYAWFFDRKVSERQSWPLSRPAPSRRRYIASASGVRQQGLTAPRLVGRPGRHPDDRGHRTGSRASVPPSSERHHDAPLYGMVRTDAEAESMPAARAYKGGVAIGNS
jgi:hypothetical protein